MGYQKGFIGHIQLILWSLKTEQPRMVYLTPEFDLALFSAPMIMGFVWDVYSSMASFILSAFFSIVTFMVFCIGYMMCKY